MSALIHELIASPVIALLAKATLLLSAGWILHRILRPANPRWRVLLWRTALVGLGLLPVLQLLVPRWQIELLTPQRPAALESLSPGMPATSRIAPPATATSLTGESTLPSSEVAGHSTKVENSPGAPAGTRTFEAESVGRTGWQTSALTIWLSVAGLLILQLFRNGVRVRRLIRQAEPAPAAVVEIARKATGDSGLLSIPEIRVSSLAAVPFAAGLFRPVVIVPESIVQEGDAQELRLILTHEFGHVAGRDLPWATAAWTIRGLLWFHPLVWRLPAAHQVACETVCDALAARCDASRAAYRRTLARLALACNRSPSLDCSVVMSATAEITQRLRRLARHIPCERLPLRRRVEATSIGFIGLATIAAVVVVPYVEAIEPPVVASPSEPANGSKATTQNESSAAVNPNGQNDDSTWTIRLQAIDADTGNPIANPEFLVQLGKTETSYDGDEKGEFAAEIPSRTPRYCYLKVRADGYTPMRGFWGNRSFDTRDALPERLTFRMTRGITVGGVVLNERQQPVEGATVLFSAGARQPEQRIEQSFWQEQYTTNELGQWRCPIAPREMNSGSININHPDYALVTSNWGVGHAVEELKAQKHTWTLKDGFVIRGVVTDPDGSPVAGAHLAVGYLNSYAPEGPFAVTDAEGRYEFRRVRSAAQTDSRKKPDQMSVTVLVQGLAPRMEVVPGTGERELGTSIWEERTMDFQLDEGEPLAIRLSDSDGQPIEDAWIFPSEWRDGTDGLTVLREHGIPQHSDEDGLWRWDTAPGDELIKYDILGRGFMEIRGKTLVAGKEYTLGLIRPQVLTGYVIDADTKEPIDEFVIQKGFEGMSRLDYPDGVWWTSNRQGRGGRYRRVVSMPKASYRWRFVAEGYEPFASESIPVQEGEVTLNVELKKTQGELPSGKNQP